MVTSEQSIKKPFALLPRRLLWLAALLIVAGAAFYAGRLNGITVGLAQQQQAAGQFFSERGGGHTGGAQGQSSGQDQFGGQNVGGQVSRVEGNTITIQTGNGETVTIQIGDTTAIRKQVAGQIADIRPGDRLVAFGARSGDVFQATGLQIGGLGAPGGQGDHTGQGAPGGQGDHTGQGGQNSP